MTALAEKISKQAKFWDRMSKSYDSDSSRTSANYDRKLSRIRSLVDETDEVLDFACATGDTGLGLAPFVARVHGIDIFTNMIAKARAKVLAHNVLNVDFTQGNIFSDSLARHSFSAILAFNIFHLLNDTPAVLERLHELLVPGGLLISNTPCLSEDSWAVRSLVGLAVSTKLAPTVHNLRAIELEALISGQGFKILESESWNENSDAQWILART